MKKVNASWKPLAGLRKGHRICREYSNGGLWLRPTAPTEMRTPLELRICQQAIFGRVYLQNHAGWKSGLPRDGISDRNGKWYLSRLGDWRQCAAEWLQAGDPWLGVCQPAIGGPTGLPDSSNRPQSSAGCRDGGYLIEWDTAKGMRG